jgi:hypothetical protein
MATRPPGTLTFMPSKALSFVLIGLSAFVASRISRTHAAVCAAMSPACEETGMMRLHAIEQTPAGTLLVDLDVAVALRVMHRDRDGRDPRARDEVAAEVQ